jgi:integrase
MKVTIVLRKDKQNKYGLSPLIIQISDGKDLARISTGITASPKDYDEKKQSLKSSYPNFAETNTKLTQIKFNISNAMWHYNEIINLTRFKPQSGTKTEIFKLIFEGFINNENMEALKEAIVTKFNNKKRPNQVYISRNIDVKKLAKIKDIVSKIGNDETDNEIDQILQLQSPIKSKEGIDKIKQKKLEDEFLDVWKKYEHYSTLKHRESTYSRIPNNLTKLQAFVKNKQIHLTFESMTEEFGMQFKNYLETIDYNYITKKKGQSEGTVHNIIKSVSTFMNWATKNKFHSNMDFKNWDTKKPTTDLFYLKEEQLVALKNMELKVGSSYDVSRDLFLFSCYTGMRYSDLENWNTSNIKDDVIRFKSVKTQKNCVVGISPVIQSILKKYTNNLPIHSNQKLNKNIKELLKKLDLDYEVQKKMRYGKNEQITEKHFSDVITFHSGRRTFINLMISKGVSIAHLSSMTGNTVNSLMVYYKNDASEIKRVIEGIQFVE